ncbi:MAG: DUF2281 domain-containing protein [Treponema sp.]|nr:DUF2281 domain-containing protein [Treponema sp.]
MNYSSIETKLKDLPQPALEEISSYIDYIFYKFSNSSDNKLNKSSKKGFGCLKEIPCRMSPDFDKTPEEFAEYM